MFLKPYPKKLSQKAQKYISNIIFHLYIEECRAEANGCTEGSFIKKHWYKHTSFFRLEKLRYNIKLADHVWESNEENGKIPCINWSHVMRRSGRISYILQILVKFRSVTYYLKSISQEIEKISFFISAFSLRFYCHTNKIVYT